LRQGGKGEHGNDIELGNRTNVRLNQVEEEDVDVDELNKEVTAFYNL